jgi:hypothetical protein
MTELEKEIVAAQKADSYGKGMAHGFTFGILFTVAFSLAMLFLIGCAHPYPYREPACLDKSYKNAMEWVEEQRQKKADEKHAIDLLRHMGLEVDEN